MKNNLSIFLNYSNFKIPIMKLARRIIHILNGNYILICMSHVRKKINVTPNKPQCSYYFKFISYYFTSNLYIKYEHILNMINI